MLKIVIYIFLWLLLFCCTPIILFIWIAAVYPDWMDNPPD